MSVETTDHSSPGRGFESRRVLEYSWTRSSAVEQDVSPTLVVTDEYHGECQGNYIGSSKGVRVRGPPAAASCEGGAARCFLNLLSPWPVMQRRMPDGTTAAKLDGPAGSTPPGHTLSGTSGPSGFVHSRRRCMTTDQRGRTAGRKPARKHNQPARFSAQAN